MPERQVRAAGGVVVRQAAAGPEVVIVHRPRYDDWSFPKGKLGRDETYAAAAVREVREETGLECRLHEELGEVRYRDPRGRPKVVRYWAMTPAAGEVVDRPPDAEVDEVRWVGAAEAVRLLSYERERELLRAALAGRTS